MANRLGKFARAALRFAAEALWVLTIAAGVVLVGVGFALQFVREPILTTVAAVLCVMLVEEILS